MKRVDLTPLTGVLVFALTTCAALASPNDLDDLARSLGGPRDGEVVFEQLPSRSGGLSSDTAFRDYVGRITWQQIADNILLSQTADIVHIEFYGFYGGYMQSHNPPTGDETMLVRFYAAHPGDGLPGDVLYEESFLNPTRSATGFNVVSDVLAPEYLFKADLSSPMTLIAGIPYWFEMVQVENTESHFRFEDGYGLLPQHATSWTWLPEWNYNPGSQAFRLSTIPEPATLTLFLLAGVLMSSAAYRRRAGMEKR